MNATNMNALTASLLIALSGPAWADAGSPTPNSTTTTVHVSLLWDGSCYQEAFERVFASAGWYPAYAVANASANIWGYLYTAFQSDVTFTTTRHGKNGAVYQVDLQSTLGAGTYTYGYSGSAANAYTFAAAGDWWSGPYGEGYPGAYGYGYASGSINSGADSGTTVFVKGANITEFKARVMLNASHFSNISVDATALAYSRAAAYAGSGWNSYAYADAYADAWAQLLSGSVVALDIDAHYLKQPGKNDLQIVVDKVTGYLYCGGSASPYASAYAYAY